MAETLEVIGDEVTIHAVVGELKDPISKEVIGHQHGNGRTYLKGEVIPVSQVSPDVLAALEDEGHPSHDYTSSLLAYSGEAPREDTGKRIGVPFEDYDNMDEEDILGAMRFLPSSAIAAIKQYEADREGREQIVNFSAGYGVDPDAHAEDRVGSDLQDADEGKKVRKIKTRAVPEEGPVEHGEGVTGTGEGTQPHGRLSDGDDDSPKGGARRRRSRRVRSTKSEDEESGSSSENE